MLFFGSRTPLYEDSVFSQDISRTGSAGRLFYENLPDLAIPRENLNF